MKPGFEASIDRFLVGPLESTRKFFFFKSHGKPSVDDIWAKAPEKWIACIRDTYILNPERFILFISEQRWFPSAIYAGVNRLMGRLSMKLREFFYLVTTHLIVFSGSDLQSVLLFQIIMNVPSGLIAVTWLKDCKAL